MRFSVVIALAGLGFAALAQASPDNPTLGEKFSVQPGTLPAPFATRSARNPADHVQRPANARLVVPQGFEASMVAQGLSNPRNLVVAPNGDLIVAQSSSGTIVILRDADKDGRYEQKFTYASGTSRPFGLALRPEGLYVADAEAVWRFDYQPGDTQSKAAPVRITKTGAFGPLGGHWTRNLAFARDGQHFYVAVGSSCNICDDEAPRATIQEFKLDGSGQRNFATGLRNAIGVAVDATSGQLFAVINERDGLGDGLVPDYLTDVQDSAFYGWPYSYIGSNPQPDYAQKKPELVKRAVVPDTLFRSHSAPIGMAIYNGTQFPERYRNGFFVALQGSWNAEKPEGYMVVFVLGTRGGDGKIKAQNQYEAFATGFFVTPAPNASVWGQPAGIAVAGDGSLLVTDDVSGTLWRIRWTGK
ncbi:MAG: PQQ-dependent sugar dehydrogenase [Rhodospirillales bacterium]